MDLVSSTFSGGRKKIEAMLRIAIAKASRVLSATANYLSQTNTAAIAAAASITYQSSAFTFKAFKSVGGNTTATARVSASIFVRTSAVSTVVSFQLMRGATPIGALLNVQSGSVTADASATLDFIDSFITAGANPPATTYGIIATAAAGTVQVLLADEASITVQEIAT